MCRCLRSTLAGFTVCLLQTVVVAQMDTSAVRANAFQYGHSPQAVWGEPAVDNSENAVNRFRPSADAGFISTFERQVSHTNEWLTIQNGDPSQSGGTQEGSGGDGGGGGADPSDPTQTTFHVITEFEWTHLRDGQGDLTAFKVSPFIPFKLHDEQLLFNFEIPLPQHADTDVLGAHTDLGDTRLKLFWLIGTENEFLKAIVPSFDAIAPTGDETTGTGGGAWILMPNIVFALQPAKNLSVYPFFRYVQSEGARSAFVADAGLPGQEFDTPEFVTGRQKINALNIETMFVFGLQDAVMDWVSITPDYFQNFSNDHGSTFTMKYDSGVALTEKVFLILAFWHPVGGEITSDFTAKISLDWYF